MPGANNAVSASTVFAVFLLLLNVRSSTRDFKVRRGANVTGEVAKGEEEELLASEPDTKNVINFVMPVPEIS